MRGSALCEHGIDKARCKECGGSAFCEEHKKRKEYCKECNGACYCKHGKQKARCEECGGSALCEHGIEKARYRECDGSAFCEEHGKRKEHCKECNGSDFCEHGKSKCYCRDCNGSAFCEHDKYKAYCSECGGNALCKQCRDTRSSSKYNGYCFRCFIYLFPDVKVYRNYKTKETAVKDFILEKFPNLDWIQDKRVYDGCSKRRPDLLLDLGYQVIIIEIDEHKHNTHECSCENKRMM